MLEKVQSEVSRQIASLNEKYNKRRDEENKKKAEQALAQAQAQEAKLELQR